jgi:hypothetical protein
VIAHPVARSLQVQVTHPTYLVQDGLESTNPSANGLVRDPVRALAERCAQNLILCDVLLMLVESAYEAIHLPEPSQNLAIAEKPTPEDRQIVLLFDVVREQAISENAFDRLRQK